jgi:glutaminyl-peptide cyclotransferase
LAAPALADLPVYRAEIVRAYPHDPDAFTEGLFFRGGRLFESTGPYDRAGRPSPSTIREVRLEDGKVLRRIVTPTGQFGEGIVDNGGEIVSLTWQNGQGYRWSLAGFKRVGTFRYPGEGWALTRMPGTIVMSDGTPQLRFLDPKTLAETRRVTVTFEGRQLRNLNELEYVRGEVLANVWHTDLIVKINPATGAATGFIDLSGLPRPPMGVSNDGVANGIAWDEKRARLFVTGKNWDKLYEIRLVPR